MVKISIHNEGGTRTYGPKEKIDYAVGDFVTMEARIVDYGGAWNHCYINGVYPILRKKGFTLYNNEGEVITVQTINQLRRLILDRLLHSARSPFFVYQTAPRSSSVRMVFKYLPLSYQPYSVGSTDSVDMLHKIDISRSVHYKAQRLITIHEPILPGTIFVNNPAVESKMLAVARVETLSFILNNYIVSSGDVLKLYQLRADGEKQHYPVLVATIDYALWKSRLEVEDRAALRPWKGYGHMLEEMGI